VADNVVLPGAGATVATDEVTDGTLGTVQVQFVKLMSGDLGGTTKYGDTTPLPVQGKQSTAQTGTITSATSTVTIAAASGYNLATIGMYGTYNGVTAVFEGSPDGSNWFAIQGQRTDSGVIETGPTTLTNTTRAWDVFVGAWTEIRVRATAWTSGTANVVVILQTMPTEPAPSVMIQPTIGGGCSAYSFLSTAAALSASIKNSPGQVYSLAFFNNSATIAYVRLYNQTTAPATTDSANIIWRGLVPGNTSGAGFTHEITNGIQFTTGIGIRVTAAVADNDATALAANAVLGNVKYK
jgi:hypothetical protein